MDARKIGQRILHDFRKDERSSCREIAGFPDNSPEKYLTRILGVPVYQPKDLKLLEAGEQFGVIFAVRTRKAWRSSLAGFLWIILRWKCKRRNVKIYD